MGVCIKMFNLYGISMLMVFIGRFENIKLRVFILKNVYIEMIFIKEIIIVVYVWIIIFDILKLKWKVWNIDFIFLLVKFYKEINKLLICNVFLNCILFVLFIKYLEK